MGEGRPMSEFNDSVIPRARRAERNANFAVTAFMLALIALGTNLLI